MRRITWGVLPPPASLPGSSAGTAPPWLSTMTSTPRSRKADTRRHRTATCGRRYGATDFQVKATAANVRPVSAAVLGSGRLMPDRAFPTPPSRRVTAHDGYLARISLS